MAGAELDKFVDEKSLENIKQFGEGVELNVEAINKAKKATDKYLESVLNLSKAQTENKTSIKELNEEQKKQAEIDKKLSEAKKAEALAEKKRLNDLETARKKEAATELKRQKQVEKTTVAFQKARLEQQKLEKRAKMLASIQDTATGSIARQRVALILLTERYDKGSEAIRKRLAPTLERLSLKIEKAEKATNRHQRGVAKYTGGLLGAGSAIKSMASSYLGWFAVISTSTKVIKDSITVLVDYQKNLKNALNLLEDFEKIEFRPLFRREAVRIAADFGLELNDVTKALFDVISAGVPAAEAIDFLRANARLAVAGNASLTSSVQGTTKAMNGYNLAATEVNKIAEILFQTQLKGQTTVQELSESIGTTTSAASQARIPFTELGATFAFLTKRLRNTDTTATAISATIKALTSPAKGAKKAFEELGIETGVVALRNNGFFETLIKVAEAAETNADVLSDLIPNVRALRGIGALTTETMQEYKDILEAIENPSEAASNISKSVAENLNAVGQKTAIARQKWSEFLVVLGGGESIFDSVSKSFLDFWIDSLDQWTNVIEKLRVRFGLLGLRISQIGTGARLAGLQVRKFFAFGKEGEELTDAINAVKLQFEDTSDQIELAKNKLDELIKKRLEQKGAIEEVREAQEGLTDAFEKENEDRVGDARETANELKRIEKGITDDAIKESEKRIAKNKESNEELVFTQRISDKDIEKEKAKIAKEEEEREKTRKEKEEEAEDLFEEKKQLKINIATEAAGALANGVFERGAARRQAELTDLEDKLNSGEITQVQFDKKRAQIQNQQAKADKRKALFDIALNTAAGIAKAVAASPLTFGLPFSAFVAAQGAIQLAAVGARPLPQFAKGTHGKYSTPGSGFVAGEAGSEIMMNRSGQTMIVDKPTFFQGSEFANNRIIPNAETKMIMGGHTGGNGTNDQLIKNLIFETKQNGKKMSNTKQYGYHITARGIEAQYRHGNAVKTRRQRFLD